MAHKRPISWCQIQNSLPTVERKTKCPLPLSSSLFLLLSLSLSVPAGNMCKQNGAQETNLWRTSANSQTFYFISFHLISLHLPLSHTHTSLSFSLSVSRMASWLLVKALLSMKIKMKHCGNATEINQLASTFVVATQKGRKRLAGKLSKKVCGKWAFPGRNKNIRKSQSKLSAFGPTLIASLASRSCSDCSSSCFSSSSRSSCCFVFYANLNITVR